MERYNKIRPKRTLKRDYHQLQSHWKRVKKDLIEFQKNYKEIFDDYKSNKSGEDIIQMVLKEWKEFHTRTFQHLLGTWWRKHKSCGEHGQALGNARGWKLHFMVTASTQRSNTPSTGDSNYSPRSIGMKQAKTLTKGKDKASSSSRGSEADVRMSSIDETMWPTALWHPRQRHE